MVRVSERVVNGNVKYGVVSPKVAVDRKKHKNGHSSDVTSKLTRSSKADVASNADTQLAMAKYRRKIKKLTEKLQEIEEQKKTQLQEIADDVREARTKQEQKLERERKAAALNHVKVELAELRQENEKLKQQQEKLKKNCRNLRINNMRLEQFSLGNGDYYEQLQRHHDRAKRENKKFTEMETEYKEKAIEAQQDYEKFTNNAHLDNKLKKMYRRNGKKMIKKAEAAHADGALLLKLYDIYHKVEKYEKKIEEALPFGPLTEADCFADVVIEDTQSGKIEDAINMNSHFSESPTRGVDKTVSAAANISIQGKENNDKSRSKASGTLNRGGRGLTKSKSTALVQMGASSPSLNYNPDTSQPTRPLPSSSVSSIDLTSKRGTKTNRKITSSKSFRIGKSGSLYNDTSSSSSDDDDNAAGTPNHDDDSSSDNSGWSSADSDSQC